MSSLLLRLFGKWPRKTPPQIPTLGGPKQPLGALHRTGVDLGITGEDSFRDLSPSRLGDVSPNKPFRSIRPTRRPTRKCSTSHDVGGHLFLVDEGVPFSARRTHRRQTDVRASDGSFVPVSRTNGSGKTVARGLLDSSRHVPVCWIRLVMSVRCAGEPCHSPQRPSYKSQSAETCLAMRTPDQFG